MPASFTVRMWGVRGSVPAPGPRTARYGGNTPCVEVRAAHAPGGEALILDAGTGIRPLGARLLAEARAAGEPVRATVCITHAHWDHIQGLPFFAPLYEPGARVRVVAAAPLAAEIERAIRDQMRPPVFPVPWEHVGAETSFGAAPARGRLRAFPAHHPGGAAGFRVESPDGGRAIVYLPDNELAGASADPARHRALVDEVRGAALLVHDATYVPGELPSRAGWGHSSWHEAVRLAADAGVARLALFHHHAERSDAAVDDIVDAARAAASGTGVEVLAASEGLTLHV